jgi:hypothetical protein
VSRPRRLATPASEGGRGGTGDLELELRQLSGVRLVSFGRSGEATLVELAAEDGTNEDRLRRDARRVTLGHIDGPVVIELVDDPASAGARLDGRVRLLFLPPSGSRARAEVHLAYRDRQVTVDAADGGRGPVAAAVLDGLRRLGFSVAYELNGAHGLPDEMGSGTIVVLTDPRSGAERRGLAPGGDIAEATARAVLDALNRSLRTPSPERPRT